MEIGIHIFSKSSLKRTTQGLVNTEKEISTVRMMKIVGYYFAIFREDCQIRLNQELKICTWAQSDNQGRCTRLKKICKSLNRIGWRVIFLWMIYISIGDFDCHEVEGFHVWNLLFFFYNCNSRRLVEMEGGVDMFSTLLLGGCS